MNKFILKVPGLYRVTGPLFTLCNLLGVSTKVEKGRATGWAISIMFLSPWRRAASVARHADGKLIIKAMAELTGIDIDVIVARIKLWNSCLFADGCKVPCLAITVGHLKFWESHLFEFVKTLLLAVKPELFYSILNYEIGRKEKTADRTGYKFAVRLNGGSDLDFIKSVIAHHPGVTFYDYTKDPNRMFRFLRGELPSNYHLTFSRGSSNWNLCKDILRMGGNVAIVLRNPDASRIGKRIRIDSFYCHVISGDVDDNRFLDDVGFKTKRGKIIELTGKGQSILEDASGFAIDSYDDLETGNLASVGCAGSLNKNTDGK